MEIQEQPKLLFFGVDIAEVKFKSLKKIEDEVKINVNIEPRGYIPKDDPTKFFILMHSQLLEILRLFQVIYHLKKEKVL